MDTFFRKNDTKYQKTSKKYVAVILFCKKLILCTMLSPFRYQCVLLRAPKSQSPPSEPGWRKAQTQPLLSLLFEYSERQTSCQAFCFLRIFHRWNSHSLLFLPQQQKQGQQRQSYSFDKISSHSLSLLFSTA